MGLAPIKSQVHTHVKKSHKDHMTGLRFQLLLRIALAHHGLNNQGGQQPEPTQSRGHGQEKTLQWQGRQQNRPLSSSLLSPELHCKKKHPFEATGRALSPGKWDQVGMVHNHKDSGVLILW